MVRRIERIAPVRGISYDIANSREERRGVFDGGGRGEFRQHLENFLRQPMKTASSETETLSKPYALQVTRATQSLFYENGSVLQGIGKRFYD